jgi:dTDP-glucose pyrophosphorylase
MRLPLEEYCINENSTIKEAMKNIDKNLTGACLVINENNQLLGVVSDGDIRRAILNNHTINDRIDGIYSRNYKYMSKIESKKKVIEYMLKYKIRQMPILDENKRLEDLYFLDDIISYEPKDNYVFILAGGLGTRLRPLTEKTPKPMLKIGDKPMLQHIIEQFREYGFKNFIISLNYKGEIIEEFFKDGREFDINIEYIRETKKLGTAGSIALADDKLKKPFIVINGDILTGVDFDCFLNYHIDNDFKITAGVRNYEIKVPYGVMVAEGSIIKSIEEKPEYTFHINSGVYAVNPEVIKYIPKDQFYNMTDLITDVTKDNHKSGIYQITEYWTDIGQMEDYKRANEDIKKFF